MTVAYQALDIVDAVLYSMALILTVPFAAFMGELCRNSQKVKHKQAQAYFCG